MGNHPQQRTVQDGNDKLSPQPLSYTIEGAMRATGLGRSLIYLRIKDGSLVKLKVGRRTLIHADSLRALIDGAA